MTPLLIAMLLLAPARSAAGQPGEKPLPQNAHVQSEVNLFIELHNHLQVASKAGDELQPEYRSELKAYIEARELAKDPRVWQIVNDACIIGPDISAIGKVAGHLPANLAAPDQEAVKKMLGALESAWPRFMAGEGIEHNRSLQVVWSKVLLKHWSLIEGRLLTALYDKFEFQPIDARITVYPVIEPNELGDWGRTDRGYYLIIPVAKMPNLVIIEELLHEVTHILADRQPAGSNSVLKQLAMQASGADKEALDHFTEGLVSWNAGEFIRRFVSADYKPLIEISPELRRPIEAYLSAYQGPWVGYLEGKISADEAIKGMAAALKPAPASSSAKTGS
ncbi:MAG TPA: hypothetical protein VFE84_06030 [Patescibacteria group bacterium]|jgi:hypothetical protein|nr:hypothetical protein [Patescibacteria group bacterium]